MGNGNSKKSQGAQERRINTSREVQVVDVISRYLRDYRNWSRSGRVGVRTVLQPFRGYFSVDIHDYEMRVLNVQSGISISA